MANVWSWLIRTIGAVGALIAGLLGGWDATMQVLCLVMALDFVTGLMVAFHGKSKKTETVGLSSKASFIGITRKVFILILVGLAVAIDTSLGMAGVLRLAVSMFYTANEGLSILENAGLLGLPMPDALKRALEQMRDKDAQQDQ